MPKLAAIYKRLLTFGLQILIVMIQRIQTIWLALAAVAGFSMSRVPLFTGTLQNASIQKIVATESLVLFALAIGTACLAIACIFLFKNRPLQFKLAVSGCVLSLVMVGLEVWQVETFKNSTALLKGTYQVGGLLPIAMFIFFVLAARSIYKDERLVKSLDRLR